MIGHYYSDSRTLPIPKTLAPITYLALLFPRLSEKNYPRLAEYYGLLKERPSVKASWPKNWLESPVAHDKLKDV